MSKLLKGQGYAVASLGEGELRGEELAKIFERAAKKRGLCIEHSFRVYPGEAAEVTVQQDIPFDTMKQIMKEIAKVTGREVFLSDTEDLLGKKLLENNLSEERAKAVLKEIILYSSPNP